MTTPEGRSTDGAREVLTLPAALSAPQVARRFLVDALDRSRLAPGDVDVATLLTSELVTNAVRYGHGTLRLQVRTGPPSVRVEVHDDNPVLPTLGPEPDAAGEGGRGLRLVDELASRWGAQPHPGDGKDVWFEIDLRGR